MKGYPSNVPNKLVRAYREHGSFHKLADALGLNVRYVHELLVKGIEPSNPETRVKLFLPRKPKAARQARPRVVFHEDLRDCHIHFRK
ncbi:MAG: hypothetical protein HY869_21020 [Chloroflexi bacterium]|nr:hypothetical protein [Chloroflexota bacterium]